MSQKRAVEEIERFLSRRDPEVLSVSGKWGVGKTYAWNQALKRMRGDVPLRRYAYVSAFGLRSIDALKTAIVQSTVSLDGPELEPTVASYIDHLSSVAGVGRLAERAGRGSLNALIKGLSSVPYVGKAADLLAPGASLLIRRQLICIDDIERAGAGLEVADVLGLVSSLRERRECKVVLFLNRDGLGSQSADFDRYLEKVVDRSVVFDPTPSESADAALCVQDPLRSTLGACITSLGIVNIRVIRRIRRFLSDVETCVTGLKPEVRDRLVQSVALLGWCLWEPDRALNIESVRKYDRMSGLFSEGLKSDEQIRINAVLDAYGLEAFDEIDEVVLAGLQAGSLNADAVRDVAEDMDARLRDGDARRALALPWTLLHQGLDDDTELVLDALRVAVEEHGSAMTPYEVTDALSLLRELGHGEEADRLLPVYIAAQSGKPRGFFEAQARGSRRIDPGVARAFARRLEEMPNHQDLGTVLVQIDERKRWSSEEADFLASQPVQAYRRALKELSGHEVAAVVHGAMLFADAGVDEAHRIVAERMTHALRIIAQESLLNRLRVGRYLADDR